MRTERTYHIYGGDGPRQPAYIDVTETHFCEDAACEAQHEDPSAKWDTRTTRFLCETNRREDAERIVYALRLVEAGLLERLRELVYSPNAKQNGMWDRARAAVAQVGG